MTVGVVSPGNSPDWLMVPGTIGVWVLGQAGHTVPPRHQSYAKDLFWGKPIARWGRKARDLQTQERRPPGCRIDGASSGSRGMHVKSNLARVSATWAHLSRYSWAFWAVLMLASMALTLGAGIKWDWFD